MCRWWTPDLIIIGEFFFLSALSQRWGVTSAWKLGGRFQKASSPCWAASSLNLQWSPLKGSHYILHGGPIKTNHWLGRSNKCQGNPASLCPRVYIINEVAVLWKRGDIGRAYIDWYCHRNQLRPRIHEGKAGRLAERWGEQERLKKRRRDVRLMSLKWRAALGL